MRVETIRHPLTGAAAERERVLRARLAEIEDTYRKAAEPYLRELVKLEDQRKVTHYAVSEPGDHHPAYMDRLIQDTQPVLIQEEDDGR